MISLFLFSILNFNPIKTEIYIERTIAINEHRLPAVETFKRLEKFICMLNRIEKVKYSEVK